MPQGWPTLTKITIAPGREPQRGPVAPDEFETPDMLEERELEGLAAAGDLVAVRSKLAQLPVIPSSTGPSEKRATALRNVLCSAARHGRADVVAYVLDQEDRPVGAYRTAAKSATFHKHWAVAELLLAHGWDINAPAEGGNTQPLLGIMTSNREVVSWLLAHGADPNVRSLSGHNGVLDNAGNVARVEELELLRAHGADFARSNALHRCADVPPRPNGRTDRGSVGVMAWLLDVAAVPLNARQYEFDPVLFAANSNTHFSGTALHSAVRGRNLEKVAFLLARGIDRGIEDFCGRKAIDLARENGFDEAVALLEA